ncbi:hypothetical protein D9758_005082 [Tetrapyrgos nigripes]|uniref:Uncharacterized protein n=1 Tax=Tetrapyrgos nigripes TaxID=182062 RepID=A0A8H5GWB6_9AGAR|nr:hypothetical protein D9758_005082 [Tetrapyrgos nigripes]
MTELFPAPSPPPSTGCPSRLPGANQESTQALRDILQDNHDKYHIFFDDFGRHNHISHHLVALWSMGSPKAVLEAAYEESQPVQRPRGTAPEPITRDNLYDHLGDHKYYAGYLEYYEGVVREKSAAAALQECVFSPQANFPKIKSGQAENPQMLDRFLGAIMHPMIHVGYGIEFGLPGLIAEGLAMAASHRCASFIPSSLFAASTPESLVSRVQNTLSLKSAPVKPRVHAFNILARILREPQFKVSQAPDFMTMYGHVVQGLRDDIFKTVDDWTIDTSTPEGIQKAIEELQFVCTLLYAVPGYREPEPFNADFFYMHFATSSLFLSAIIPILPAASQEMLLRGFFAVIISWWILNGRPNLAISNFFSADTAHPTITSANTVQAHAHALPSPSSPLASNPNPWTSIVSQSLVHPDDHLIKLVRALVHYATLYGSRAASEKDFLDTGLEGAEKIDGTLFIRAAGLTMDRILGQMPSRENLKEYVMYWDREGFHTWSEKGKSVY